MLINKPYRLNVGIPSQETITFIKSLLNILSNNNNNKKLKLISTKFINSVFLNSNNQSDVNQEMIVSKLINNCKESFEDKKISIFTKSSYSNKELWLDYAISDYQELYNFLIPKCLSLFTIKCLSSKIEIKMK